MKYLVLSDIHADFNFDLYNKKHQNDWSTEQANETFSKWYEYSKLPETEGLIIAGDISNDVRSYKQFIDFIAPKYKEIIITLGNHDLVVKGGTCSTSNNNFKTSKERIDHMKAHCAKYSNVHLLEGATYGPFAGCMGMCDFEGMVNPMYKHNMLLLWRNWFDYVHWRYFDRIHSKIWEHYDKMMMDLVKKQPKVMITHFVPEELGLNWDYRNSMYNGMFYFKGKKFLDEMADGSIWICGHIHSFATANYVNEKGNKITIMARPHGYPGENPFNGFKWLYPCDIEEGSNLRPGFIRHHYNYDDCIIEI